MNPNLVICLGNRYAAGDDTGSRVYDYLEGRQLPGDVDLVDGGLCGLDLLSLMDGRRRVVFVDALAGVADCGEIAVLEHEAVSAYARNYGHSAGLPYLLHMQQQLQADAAPEIVVIGAEGVAEPTVIPRLAERCLEIAVHGIA